MIWYIVIALIAFLILYGMYQDSKNRNIEADIHQKRYYRIKLEHCDMLDYLNEWQHVLGKDFIRLESHERRD